MENSSASGSRWKSDLDQAKAEILGPEALSAPEPLINLANGQLIPIIREMEDLLRHAADQRVTIDRSAIIHLNAVRTRYVDEAVEVLEDALDSHFFSRACDRFVKRYERIFAERGITMPSPA